MEPRSPEAAGDDSRELFARASRGEAPALESLLVRHMPALLAYVRLQAGPRVRAQESLSDLVQSVCVEVLKDAAGFDYRGEGQFKHWLFVQALHKIQNKDRHYRAAKRRPPPAAGHEDETRAVSQCYATLCTPSRVAAGREHVAAMERAFDELPADQRQAVVLRRVVGLDYSAIAAEMGKTEGAVRTLVYRGVARLATLLRADAGD